MWNEDGVVVNRRGALGHADLVTRRLASSMGPTTAR